MIKNAEIARRNVIAKQMYFKENSDRLRKQMKTLRTNEQKASLKHLAEIEYYKDKIKSLHNYASTISEEEKSQTILTEGNRVAHRPFYDTRKQAFLVLRTRMRIKTFFFSILFSFYPRSTSPLRYSLSPPPAPWA